MIELSDLISHIAPNVPACPGMLLSRECLRVAQDFALKTWVLNSAYEVTVSSISISEGTSHSVDVDVFGALEEGEMVTHIRDLYINGKSQTIKYLNLKYNSEMISNMTNRLFFNFPNTHTVRLFPVVGDMTVFMRVIRSPQNDATKIADVIFTRYLQAIIDGTLAALYAQPEKQWTNLRLVAKKERDYRRACVRAKRDAVKEFQDTTLAVRPQSFGGVPDYENRHSFVFE